MSADTVLPDGRWEFDSEVTSVFENMLERSIPQYATMRALVHEVSVRVAPVDHVVDLGCSRGDALASFGGGDSGQRLIGLEVSEPMLAAASERFAEDERFRILRHDLRAGLPREAMGASLILSVLTLMFVPIEHRAQVIEDVFAALRPGGAFVLVEKVLGATAPLDAVLVSAYLDGKRTAGYSEEQILRKKLSLEGVLVPVRASWNEELLRSAGFRTYECFWRCLNFAGWIALKEDRS